jgi:ATP-binding cassette, subfamily B, bacterial IrtB/YbtQ
MVFQDVELLAGTIGENIRLGRPGAGDAEVLDAARQAGVDEILERLPDGLDASVGEHGTGLSGDERQRISIARALVKKAPVLLLDEPTSSLDGHHQRRIDDSIARLRGTTTVLLATHRLAAIRDADQILVLDDGRLVEHGRHDELVQQNGVYATLLAPDDPAGTPDEPVRPRQMETS